MVDPCAVALANATRTTAIAASPSMRKALIGLFMVPTPKFSMVKRNPP
jgi:hypothetical protein